MQPLQPPGFDDNPLFGSALLSPSPISIAQASSYNPVWSPALSTLTGPSLAAPSSALGMRRLGDPPPTVSSREQPAFPAFQQAQLLEDPGSGAAPSRARDSSSGQGAAAGDAADPASASPGGGGPILPLPLHLLPAPPTAALPLRPSPNRQQAQPILPTSPAGGGGSGAMALPQVLSQALVPGRERPEEQAFAETLGAVMRGELDAAEALSQYAAICRQQAANLREAASSQLSRAARYATLTDAAAELDGEASSWHLLWHLHGVQSRDFPGRRGGNFVEGAGLAKTFRQRVSDLLFQDAALNRCGRTVAWLEFLAGEALDRAPGVPFSSTDGVWRETSSRLTSGAVASGRGAFAGSSREAGALVTELDPDAPTRQRRRLDVENAQGEEMLTAHLWKLVRAGRVSAARRLCEDVGQPWRAASLGGAGAQGPVPLAAAADEADDVDSAWEQAEDMAAEVDGGAGALRALWRWSCLQLAERVGAAAEQAGGGLHEAAIYAALASHLARLLPVCTSWEDVCWSYLRCWLDLAVDARLGVGAEEGGAGGAAAPAAQAALVELAGGEAGVVAEGLEVAKGAWPLDRLRASLPPSFEAALQAADSGAAAAGASAASSAAGQRFRTLQRALILDQIQALVCSTLVDWVLQGSGAAGSGAGGAAGAGVESPTRGAQPACPPGLMRFAAHLALSLWALDIAKVPRDGRPGAAYDEVHDVLHKVVQVYVIHLIDSGAHDLVPLYACHLRAGLRHMTYQIFFEQLVAQSPMESCRSAYRLADTWFTYWQHGDIAPNEMALIATRAAARSRYEVVGGPQQRARFARWLCFGAATRVEALRHANLLCREFALGGAGGLSAAAALLTQQLPSALGMTLEAFLLEMENSGATGGGADGAAAAAQQAAQEEIAAQAAELRCWSLYYEYETEFGGWQALYSDTMAAPDPQELRQESAALAQRTLPLLTAMLSFLHDGWLESLVDGGAAVDGAATEVVIVVGPERGPGAEAEVQDGDAFPTFASADEQQAAAEELLQALGRAAAGQQGLRFVVGPAPEGMPGMLTVAAECSDTAALDSCVVLLSQAIKGCLQGAEGVGPLVVVNVDAPPTVSAALCRCMCFPRVVLKCGALREALAFMGHSGDEGDELAGLVAGARGGQGPPLAMYFSQPELQELLQFERAATVLQMRNAEAAEQEQRQAQAQGQ